MLGESQPREGAGSGEWVLERALILHWRGREKINKWRGLIAAIITAFIWLPNESHHRQREKLSLAQALMNFFANCNQGRAV